ncbi:unnamed protein product [Cochlearia groenlandica]
MISSNIRDLNREPLPEILHLRIVRKYESRYRSLVYKEFMFGQYVAGSFSFQDHFDTTHLEEGQAVRISGFEVYPNWGPRYTRTDKILHFNERTHFLHVPGPRSVVSSVRFTDFGKILGWELDGRFRMAHEFVAGYAPHREDATVHIALLFWRVHYIGDDFVEIPSCG